MRTPTTQKASYFDDPIHNGGNEEPGLGRLHWEPADLSDIKKIRLDGVKILLVDDSQDNQKLFQRILVSAGGMVEIAENGEVAVRMQKLGEYDVIIMDIRMPILDGYEATRRIRNHGFSGPVLALTAHATPGEEKRCRDAGCSAFFLKPIDRMTLLKAVGKAAGRLA